MAVTHEVRPGEHLGTIARRYGTDAQAILDLPANKALSTRPHPGVLDPGEVVTVPAHSNTAVVSTGATHRLVVGQDRPPLRIRLLSPRGQALVAERIEVTYDDTVSEEVVVGDDGTIELPIGHATTGVALEVTLPPQGDTLVRTIRWALVVGGLRRAEGEEGSLLRLAHLGYLRPAPTSLELVERRSAIEEFQHDYGLPVTGDLDESTTAKLEEIHGC